MLFLGDGFVEVQDRAAHGGEGRLDRDGSGAILPTFAFLEQFRGSLRVLGERVGGFLVGCMLIAGVWLIWSAI